MRSFGRFEVVLLAMSLAVPMGTISGQSGDCTVVGTVVDSTGAIVAGAAVTVTDVSNGVSVTVRSGQDGTFKAEHLLPDTYNVNVVAPGFIRYEQLGVHVGTTSWAKLQVALQVGATSEPVMVTASEAPGASVSSAAPAPSRMPRVSGWDALVPNRSEQSGYGLYSYALLSHAPSPDELPLYNAFFSALVAAIPNAGDLPAELPRARINLTIIPVTDWPSKIRKQSSAAQAAYLLAHYNYARAAAMLASLPGHPGAGPVLVSTLQPLSYDRQPHPVLLQDLSKAQPSLMSAYIERFKQQAASDHFWQPSVLASFALTLQNLLTTAAQALSLAQPAVGDWVKYLK